MKKIRKQIQAWLPKLIGKKLEWQFLLFPKSALNTAFVLFCTPRKGKVREAYRNFLDKAKKEEVKVLPDVTLQTYHWPGKGETVLLIHGWESNTARWRTLIRQLQKEDYNIYAFDAPGHGNSSGKILNVILYEKCLRYLVQRYQPETIVGHSIGGMTMIYNQFLKSTPEVEKLVVLGAPSELKAFVDNFQSILGLSNRFMKAWNAYFKKRFGFYFEEFSISGFAKGISQSGLLIHDTLDAIVPVRASEAIHHNWKNSIFVRTEGFGHSLSHKNVDASILQFLKTPNPKLTYGNNGS